MSVAAAKQNVRLNSDTEHLFHGVLCRLGFLFASGGDVRNQRHVNEKGVLRAEFKAHLPNRFQKRQRFNVAHSAANLHDDDVHTF